MSQKKGPSKPWFFSPSLQAFRNALQVEVQVEKSENAGKHHRSWTNQEKEGKECSYKGKGQRKVERVEENEEEGGEIGSFGDTASGTGANGTGRRKEWLG